MSTRTTAGTAGSEGITATVDPDALPGLQEQVLLLQTGQTSSRELVGAAIGRARAAQVTLNAFRVICEEEALRAADDADRRLATGEGAPLLGVPVAIKDDVDFGGHTTPFGCGGGKPAVRDAEAVRRLREAGAPRSAASGCSRRCCGAADGRSPLRGSSWTMRGRRSSISTIPRCSGVSASGRRSWRRERAR